jgi:hypothetical protein
MTDIATPKRTKALPVAVEREQWRAQVDALSAALTASRKMAVLLKRLAWTAGTAGLAVGVSLGRFL